ncbi:MAG: polysaccharide biosynthesis protein, partial [Ilumatobacteraceae bacterium]
MYLDNKRVLITGGTGSLGKVLTRRILSGQMGTPQSVVVFSRDEAKQHEMRMDYLNRRSVTEEVMYHNFERKLQFKIGDVRDFHSVAQALTNIDIVFNAAALKQVPACEYFPYEAVRTNIEGAENIVRAIKELRLEVETVVAISTDKACKPTNVMGMTKAIQERIFLTANIDCPKTRFVAVRYGNVLASRGSVVPLFLDQIDAGGPITITEKNMTRFLLTLDQAVDTVFEAMQFAEAGETYIPKIKAARIVDVVSALIGKTKIEIKETGVRPGEKLHEV